MANSDWKIRDEIKIHFSSGDEETLVFPRVFPRIFITILVLLFVAKYLENPLQRMKISRMKLIIVMII